MSADEELASDWAQLIGEMQSPVTGKMSKAYTSMLRTYVTSLQQRST